MKSFKEILSESNMLVEGLNVNSLKAGDKIMVKYRRVTFPAEFLGFTDDSEKYGEKPVFKTHKELLNHYKATSVKELETMFDQKGDNYGRHPYMVVKELEDGQITTLYPYKGYWAIGSSADRASFEKYDESQVSEALTDNSFESTIKFIKDTKSKVVKLMDITYKNTKDMTHRAESSKILVDVEKLLNQLLKSYEDK